MSIFSERLNEILLIRNVSAAEISRKTDIPESVMSQYKKGMYVPKQKRLDKLSQILNVSTPWLLGEDVPMERISNTVQLKKIKKIPLLGKIACGNPIFANKNIDRYICLPNDVDATFALICKGNSMIDAGINDGDIVYIKRQDTVNNGEIAAVLIDKTETEATLKKFFQNGNTVILQSANNEYSPFIYEKENINKLRILGKVIAVLSFK